MNNPKIGICSWSLPVKEEEKPAILSSLGLNGLELNFSRNEDGVIPLDNSKERKRLKERLRTTSHDYSTLGVNELCRVGMAVKENRTAAVDILKRAIEAALDMHCTILQVPSFGQGMIENEKHLENTIACFEEACLYARGEQLYIATENSLDVSGNLTMIKAINNKNFKVYFDTQNPHLFGIESVSQMVESLFPFICEVHLKDGDDSFGNHLLGEGKAGTEETVRKLLKMDYSGWFYFETSYQDLAEKRKENPLDLIKKDVAWINHIIESQHE